MRSLARMLSVPVWTALVVVIAVGLLAGQWWMGSGEKRIQALQEAVVQAQLAAQRLPRWVLELPVDEGLSALDSTRAAFKRDFEQVDAVVVLLQEGGDLSASGGPSVFRQEDVPASAQPASAVVAEAWSQLRDQLSPLLDVERVDRGAAGRIAELTAALDGPLLRLRELLSEEIQRSESRAGWLLWLSVLLFAALLALSLWIFALKQGELETVRTDAQEMLDAVPVGLFTLDEDYRLGHQVSPQLMQMFGTGDLADRNLVTILRELLPDETVDTAKEFVSLLFSERVNENLIASLNPLDQVQIGGEDDDSRGRRFLDFAFRRMRVKGKVVRLLVTVTDITERVVLNEELDRLRGEGDVQSERVMEVVVGLLKADRKMIEERVTHWRVALKEANQSLKQSARGERGLRQLIDRVFRPVHLVKGEAAAMGLGFITQRAKATELELGLLRDREQLEGNDFLPVAVRLEDLFGQLDVLERMLKQLSKLSTAPAPADKAEGKPKTPPPSFLQSVVAGLSSKLGRQARVVLEGQPSESLPEDRRRQVDDILGQLARNALAHGLESAEERSRAGKTPVGEIRYGLAQNDQGEIELSFRDDGRGIDLETVRRKAVASRRFSPDQAAKMNPKQLMGLIFLPGFSTRGGVDDAAGRGVGLDIVAHSVKRLGGRIGVQSVPGQFTQFRIRLPATDPAAAKGKSA